jgi:predicted dehydrogenase
MRIAIHGLGLRVAHLLGFFREQVPDTVITGYVDPSPFGLEYLLQSGYPMPRAYASLDVLLDAQPADLLLIGSPNHLHLAQIRCGLEHGVRVLTEKPVVISEAETFELLHLLRTHGAERVLVGLVLRYSPLYRTLTRYLHDGLLGALTSIEASEHITPDHGAFFMRDWRRLESYSGGYLLEKCCHDLDVYQSLIGARPRRVASFGGRTTFLPAHAEREAAAIYREKPAGWDGRDTVFCGDGDIVDNQVAIIEYASGVRLCFHANLNVPDAFRRFCLVGVDGTAEGDFERNYLRIHDARTREKRVDWRDGSEEMPGHYGAEPLMVRDIVQHLRDGSPLPVDVIQALETGLTAIKVDEARRLGCVLELDDLWQRFDAACPAAPPASRV